MSTPSPNTQNPYAPPSARVQDVAPDVGSVELAERSQRLGAVIVDVLVGFACYLPVLIFVVARWDRAQPPVQNFLHAGVAGFAISGCLALIMLVVTIVWVARYGQTIGKRALGIRVARPDGSKASIGRIFWLRNVVNGVLNVVVSAALGAILGALHAPVMTLLSGYVYGLVDSLMIFGETRQCLHDRIANTIVVKA